MVSRAECSASHKGGGCWDDSGGAFSVVLFMMLEREKLALRKWRRKHDGRRGSLGRSEAKS